MARYTCAVCRQSDDSVVWGYRGDELHKNCYYRIYGTRLQKVWQDLRDRVAILNSMVSKVFKDFR